MANIKHTALFTSSALKVFGYCDDEDCMKIQIKQKKALFFITSIFNCNYFFSFNCVQIQMKFVWIQEKANICSPEVFSSSSVAFIYYLGLQGCGLLSFMHSYDPLCCVGTYYTHCDLVKILQSNKKLLKAAVSFREIFLSVTYIYEQAI